MNINGKIYKNPLFVFAMEAEAANEFQEFRKTFTGLGKLNAAYTLMKEISKTKPDIVINLGTAGSSIFQKGEVVCCKGFIQRDMNVTELGFEKYKTPFSEENPVLVYGLKISNLKEGICGTGDNFESDHQVHEYNVVDMEAYALALICKRENIPFLCLKYISDGANSSAADDWREEVKKAPKKLKEALFP